MKAEPNEDAVREHVFDGIQEYDKRLPNWWLVTLWGAIIYAAIHWMIVYSLDMRSDDGEVLVATMKANALALQQSSGVVDDASLWAMSRDPAMVDAGKTTYLTNCASCHLPTMLGQSSGGIGPNLVDNVWIHGNQPTQVWKTVSEGVIAKGMPPWAPILGRQKTLEATAYILSHHTPPEGAK